LGGINNPISDVEFTIKGKVLETVKVGLIMGTLLWVTWMMVTIVLLIDIGINRLVKWTTFCACSSYAFSI